MTFAAPLFLIAMLAGAIPVVLHMINRQKAAVMPFSTLRFLRISVQRTRRRKYLHDVLLLILRVAALVLIAVALAKPTISRLGNLLGRQAASAIVLVLDNSSSMATVDEGGPRWELAVKAAEQLLEQLGDADSVALLPTCGPLRPELQKLYVNQEVVRQSLDACRVSYERADLTARLREARTLLEKADAPNKEIYVVTDMQAVSWEMLQHDDRQNIDNAAEKIPVVLVDVHRPRLTNVALQRVQLRSAGPVAGVPVQVNVELLGDAQLEQKRHVELSLDGQQVELSPTLTLPPAGRAEQVFQFRLDRPGIHRGEVRLVGEDASVHDDQLFFAISVDPHIPVAVVQSRDHEISYLEDSYYLERALVPVVRGSWAIRTTRLTPSALAAEPLSNYAVIYCVNLPTFAPAVARRLRDYVRRGGHVVWICGPNVDPVLYTAMDEQVNHELLPLRLTGVREPAADRPDGWRIGWLDGKHKALAPLADPVSLHQSVLVYRHVSMASDEGSGARVLARLDDGEPLLVERTVGSGSVLVLGTSVHVDWSNLPLRPIFLPLVSRLTFYLAGAEATQPHLVAGAPLVIPFAGEGEPTIEVLHPDGETVRVDVEDTGQTAIRYSDTHEVGIYHVHVREVARRHDMAFAVNHDPDEVASAVMSRSVLEQRWGKNSPLVFCEDPTDLATTIQRLREGESLLEVFLLVVLVALVLETLVANRRIEKRPRAESVLDETALAESESTATLGVEAAQG